MMATFGITAAMPQLIDLDSLDTSLDGDFRAASQDSRLDSLAHDLADLVCPPSALGAWRAADKVLLAESPSGPTLQAAGHYELPDAYSFTATTRIEADLARLMADLETEVRRARRGRWIAQVMALPV
jgi:hypothetical protein